VSYPALLESEFQAFHIRLPARQLALLAKYCEELERWNQRINLTGLSGSEMVRRLIVEPVWIGLELGISGKLADIGSGNGSPGLPLHITGELQRLHLIEARTKRAVFLRHVVSSMKLSGIVVHRGRFEDVASELEKVDWVTLQGVAADAQLIETIGRVATATTTIVWITSGVHSPLSLPQSGRLKLPITGTEVLLFQPDLS